MICIQGKWKLCGSLQVVLLANLKTSWQYFFPIYWDSLVASLGSQFWKAELYLQLYSTVLYGYLLPVLSSLFAERKVLFLLKGTVRINRQISESTMELLLQ